MKPKVQIFEGIPGSGKTTLKYALGERTNYRYLQIDRFTGSQWVFGKYRGIDVDVSEIEKSLRLSTDVHVIRMVCPLNIAFERREDRCTMEYLKEIRDLYDKYFEEISNFTNVITVNSATMTVEEEIERVLERL